MAANHFHCEAICGGGGVEGVRGCRHTFPSGVASSISLVVSQNARNTHGS